MARGLHPEALRSRLRRLKKKYPGETFKVLRASNGEVAIVRQSWYDACMRAYERGNTGNEGRP